MISGKCFKRFFFKDLKDLASTNVTRLKYFNPKPARYVDKEFKQKLWKKLLYYLSK